MIHEVMNRVGLCLFELIPWTAIDRATVKEIPEPEHPVNEGADFVAWTSRSQLPIRMASRDLGPMGKQPDSCLLDRSASRAWLFLLVDVWIAGLAKTTTG